MEFHVSEIPPAGRRIVADLAVSDLPLLKELAHDEAAGFEDPVHVDLRLIRQGVVSVTAIGTASARVAMACGRCLDETVVDVFAEVNLLYEPGADDTGADAGEVVELSDADMQRIRYDGDRIDLAPAVQEEILSALPFRALCREDCRGLCPGCGANLNHATCTCGGPPTDPRLAVLKNWQRR